MPISVACQCGQSYQAPESLVGRSVKCRKCDRVLVVPRRASEPVVEIAADDWLVRTAPPASIPASRPDTPELVQVTLAEPPEPGKARHRRRWPLVVVAALLLLIVPLAAWNVWYELSQPRPGRQADNSQRPQAYVASNVQPAPPSRVEFAQVTSPADEPLPEGMGVFNWAPRPESAAALGVPFCLEAFLVRPVAGSAGRQSILPQQAGKPASIEVLFFSSGRLDSWPVLSARAFELELDPFAENNAGAGFDQLLQDRLNFVVAHPSAPGAQGASLVATSFGDVNGIRCCWGRMVGMHEGRRAFGFALIGAVAQFGVQISGWSEYPPGTPEVDWLEAAALSVAVQFSDPTLAFQPAGGPLALDPTSVPLEVNVPAELLARLDGEFRMGKFAIRPPKNSTRLLLESPGANGQLVPASIWQVDAVPLETLGSVTLSVETFQGIFFNLELTAQISLTQGIKAAGFENVKVLAAKTTQVNDLTVRWLRFSCEQAGVPAYGSWMVTKSGSDVAVVMGFSRQPPGSPVFGRLEASALTLRAF